MNLSDPSPFKVSHISHRLAAQDAVLSPRRRRFESGSGRTLLVPQCTTSHPDQGACVPFYRRARLGPGSGQAGPLPIPVALPRCPTRARQGDAALSTAGLRSPRAREPYPGQPGALSHHPGRCGVQVHGLVLEDEQDHPPAAGHRRYAGPLGGVKLSPLGGPAN